MIISTSEEVSRNLSTAFKTPMSSIKITGYPRNDALFSNKQSQSKPSIIRKVIYLPTFRGLINTGYDILGESKFDFITADKELKKLGIKLYLKFHPINKPPCDMIDKIKHSENLELYESDDIYNEFSLFDCSITDYSSIFFDFLLTNRPIVVFPFDLKTYLSKGRPFYYDYNLISAGPKAFSWDEVFACIEHINDVWKTKKDEIIQKFNKYEDGNSCRRVFQEVTNILKDN